MRRPFVIAVILLALVVPVQAAATEPAPPSGRAATQPGGQKPKQTGKRAARSWADSSIRTVTGRGLMGGDPAAFRPDDALTRGELAELVSAIAATPAAPAVRAQVRVSVAGLDSALVRALGLADAAGRFAAVARGAGLRPPTRFGTEVVARLLGLRTNHPAERDELELVPADPVSRAETAFSIARVLDLRGWEVPAVAADSEAFALPAFTPWQKRILGTAFSLIGYPYVWAGTSERPQAPLGKQRRGGFDCSGFVWRVYKLENYGVAKLESALRGRTTFAMSGEVERARRIGFARLAPADVVFFGAKGPRSKPAEVDHMGIYVGGGWMIHSSRFGVALAELEGYYRTRFAWARRPLAEAGLTPSNEG